MYSQFSEETEAAAGRIRVSGIELRRVLYKGCGHVQRELLDFVANNSFHTKRFAYYVGRHCRQATIKEMARELNLDWETIKTLEKQYARTQLAHAELWSCRRASSPGT